MCGEKNGTNVLRVSGLQLSADTKLICLIWQTEVVGDDDDDGGLGTGNMEEREKNDNNNNKTRPTLK